MNIIFVPVQKTIINHYQSESGIDQDKVVEIAESVKQYRDNGQKGLLQLPTARPLPDGCYEFAFGRHRRAAFLLLAETDNFYNEIPVNVQDLSDQEMLELMGIEQMNKRHVDILEIGETLHRYMTDFHKTSVDAALKFSKSDEYVRSAIRMLNLPEEAKTEMKAGNLNISGGRSVLTLTRVLPNDQAALKAVLAEIKDGEKPEEAVEQALRMSPNTKIIGSESDGHFSMKAKTFKYLPELTVTEASHHCGVDPKVLRDYHDKGVWQLRIEKLSKGIQAIELPGSDNAEELERMRKIQHLVKPPACTACPLFATIDGTGYCGWVACFDRKKAASEEAELHKVSEAVGIAVYSEKDGKALEMHRWNDKHENAFKKKHADLRLRYSHSYNTWEGVPSYFAVVAVGNLLQTWNKQEEKAKQGTEKREGVDPQRQRMINNIVETQTELFAWDIATQIFASKLDGVDQVEFLECLLENSDFYPSNVLPDHDKDQLQAMKKAARLQLARRKIVFSLLFREGTPFSLNTAKQPATALANEFQKVATTWGVKLPKDFLAKAGEYDEAVKLAIAELDKQDGAE